MTGLGELFVIRVAGNVVGPIELASAVYACEHLHTRLLLVLGHTHCGAIKAALDGEAGPVAAITERIAAALGDVRDPYEASVANARRPRRPNWPPHRADAPPSPSMTWTSESPSTTPTAASWTFCRAKVHNHVHDIAGGRGVGRKSQAFGGRVPALAMIIA